MCVGWWCFDVDANAYHGWGDAEEGLSILYCLAAVLLSVAVVFAYDSSLVSLPTTVSSNAVLDHSSQCI